MKMADSTDAFLPLHAFRLRGGFELPAIRELPPDAIPAPYHDLLVHRGHMTPTLEAYHGAPLGLHLLDHFRDGDAYYRTVLLTLPPDGRPVEFGAIRIRLEAFSEAARQAVLDARIPLGTLLREHGMGTYSQPQLFFATTVNPALTLVLGRQSSDTLYGRCNVLLTNDTAEPIADIVEILPA